MDPYSKDELLTHHTGGRHGDVEPSDDDLPSGRVPRRAPEPFQSRVDYDGGDGTFHGIMIGYLGFSDEGAYMGGGLTLGEPCGPHTTSPHAGRWTRAARWCGGTTAPLRLSFGVRVRDGKILTRVFIPCNSENISCVGFLKQKTAENRNGHCGNFVNRLVAGNQ